VKTLPSEAFVAELLPGARVVEAIRAREVLERSPLEVLPLLDE
jgi:hypothetical protein